MVAVSVADAYSEPSVNRSDMSRALKNRFCRGSCSTCADTDRRRPMNGLTHDLLYMRQERLLAATVTTFASMCHATSGEMK